MYCPECGNNIADESTKFCPVCGYELNNAQQPKFNLVSEQPQQSNINNQQPMYNPQSGGGYQQPVYNSQPNGGYSQPPKQNTGLIIGVIIGAVVLIVAIVAFLIFFVFKKGDTGNNDTTGAQTVESTQNSSDIALGTYSISSMRLEGSDYSYSDIDSMGYGEMTLRVENDYIYFKQTADGYDVPYYYSGSNGTGKIWNSAEEYSIYYTDDTVTIDFASSEDFSDYTEYKMTFTK